MEPELRKGSGSRLGLMVSKATCLFSFFNMQYCREMPCHITDPSEQLILFNSLTPKAPAMDSDSEKVRPKGTKWA